MRDAPQPKPAARPRRLMPGTLFLGEYLIEALIGQGAMGLVYRARHAESRELFAIKLMNADLVDEAGFAERFVQEAAIGSSIPSEGITKVYAAGIDAGTGLPWMAMEFLEGRDLATFMDQDPPPARETRVALLVQLFEAIAVAHRTRIVHRDLKPENLFAVEREGALPRLKVLDFGVAKVVRDATLGGTRPGLGAPLWAAPEQGKSGQKILASSDVWSLGLLSFWMLTGKRYWLQANDPSASQFDLAVEILRADLPAPSLRAAELEVAGTLPAGFDQWFARCMQRSAERRFEDASLALRPLALMLGVRPLGGLGDSRRATGPITLAAIAVGAVALCVSLWLIVR